jgi:hypothetical protein
MQASELPHQGAAARSAPGRAPPPDLQTLIPALKVAGDAPPSPGSLLQSHLEGGDGDAARCGDDAEANMGDCR